MIVIRDPDSSLPLVLVATPQEPGVPPAQDRGATPTDTETGTPKVPTDPNAPKQSCNDALLDQLPLLLGFVAIFYFLIIRPGQKTEKARKAMLSALKKGDDVVTNSGMHGKVAALSDTSVTLQVQKDIQLKFDRAAIARVLTDETPPASDAGSGGSGS